MPMEAYKPKNNEYWKPLGEVVTLAEAARITGRYESSVRRAIDSGNVAAVKCGRVWLVSRKSVLNWFSRG